MLEIPLKRGAKPGRKIAPVKRIDGIPRFGFVEVVAHKPPDTITNNVALKRYANILTMVCRKSGARGSSPA